MLIEACVDTLASAINAERGGADRVELCDNLGDAGTTPSHGTLRLALEQLTILVFPIIRPRGGGFVYDEYDTAVMRADLAHARDLGAPGAVIGAITPDGDVHEELIATLRADAPDMQLTFHRAFDVCRDPHTALATLIRLGIDRVLTSGQAADAWEGRELIAELIVAAGGKIAVMPGGGVNEQNAGDLVRATGALELHVRGATLRRDAGPTRAIPFRKAPPADELARGVTDPLRVAAIRRAVAG
ncbi:MAG: copper homeostasis protein CutC [Betaproteobacteria bacterium]